MMESEVMGNYHASFGERDGETRTMRIVKVRAVPTLLSPVLANMALDGLEKILCEKYPKKTGGKVHLVRYADDFIITGASKELLEKEEPITIKLPRNPKLPTSPVRT